MKYKTTLKFLFSILFLGVLAYSCSNATDIVQESELYEPQAFNSVENIQSGLNSAYSAYGPDFGSNDAGVDAIYFNEIFTDNVKRGIDNNGQGVSTYSFILQPGSDTPGTIWGNRYAVINRVNRVFRGIETFEASDEYQRLQIELGSAFETDVINELRHVRGQLYALRALAHLDLFQYFTVDYQNPTDLSIINVDFVPDIDSALAGGEQYERNTVEETVTFISDDLNSAEEFLDSDLALAAGNIYLNNDAINFIRTRLALFTGDYQSAYDLSAALLNNYILAPSQQYIDMFDDSDDTEVIFKLQRLDGDASVAGLFYFNGVNATGGAYIEMSNDLYNQFDVNDVRLQVNVTDDSTIDGENLLTNRIFINKYPGGANALTNDIKLFRASELQLIKAECEARLMDFQAAQNSIAFLRTFRNIGPTPPPTPDYGGDLSVALTDILAERRIELCFEGHRYLDLKRIGGELGIGISRESSDCLSFTAPCNLPANDFKFTLPIPTSEIEGNSVISQNPEY